MTEAGKVGGQLAKDFFKEEYMLNSKIGKYSMRQLINWDCGFNRSVLAGIMTVR